MASTSDLIERTEASLEKYKQRADELREELSSARAATKVQIKAMVQRLEEKYDDASSKLKELRDSSDGKDDLEKLHREVTSDLSDMVRTIKRRIR